MEVATMFSSGILKKIPVAAVCAVPLEIALVMTFWMTKGIMPVPKKTAFNAY
jgi:hypothetical protein